MISEHERHMGAVRACEFELFRVDAREDRFNPEMIELAITYNGSQWSSIRMYRDHVEAVVAALLEYAE